MELTDARFLAWVDRAKAGDEVEYHCGLLTRDRGAGMSERSEDEARVHDLAVTAWYEYQAGRVHLVQRRYAFNTFGYVAIRRPDAVKRATHVAMAA